jgi:hypothetical protein
MTASIPVAEVLAQRRYGGRPTIRKRRAVSVLLRGQGMSTRAIAPALGVHHDTVSSDLTGVGFPTPESEHVQVTGARPAQTCTRGSRPTTHPNHPQTPTPPTTSPDHPIRPIAKHPNTIHAPTTREKHCTTTPLGGSRAGPRFFEPETLATNGRAWHTHSDQQNRIANLCNGFRRIYPN